MPLRWFAPLVVLAGCLANVGAVAQTAPTEMPGGKDHPLISRYAGSVLQNMAEERFVSLRVPGSAARMGADGRLTFARSTTIEGRVSAYFYIQPTNRSALEVFHNYRAALQQAGFATDYVCEMQACDQALIKEQFSNEVVRPRKWSADRADPASAIERDVRFVSAKASHNGADVYVMVYVAEPNSIWQAPVAVVLVAEPAPMETGKVVISTDQLQLALASEGKIALYGIYFATGAAEINSESKPQLDEMGRLLAANKVLKVLIVGHTDNQGTIESNLALSQRRAEAVIAVLVKEYKIGAARLRAQGVANFSPVASNASESGRARNRRVELVAQ